MSSIDIKHKNIFVYDNFTLATPTVTDAKDLVSYNCQNKTFSSGGDYFLWIKQWMNLDIQSHLLAALEVGERGGANKIESLSCGENSFDDSLQRKHFLGLLSVHCSSVKDSSWGTTV